MRVKTLTICYLCFAACAVFAAEIQFLAVRPEVLEQRLRLAHKDNAERYRRLVKLLEETGCRGDAYREQPVKHSRQPNLVCEVAGSGASDRRIVIGAHFDATGGGDGVIDNWSGASLLPSLAEIMRSKPRRHPFEFVGFAGEELGLLGSAAYVMAIRKEERGQIAAAVVIDSVGMTPVKCWPNGSSKELVSAAARVAEAMRIPFIGMNVDQVGTTDSAPFQRARIPVLSLHSLTQETFRKINGPGDVWSAVSWKDYYETHRFIAGLLVYLDETLP